MTATNWAPIPAWQITQLQQLSNQGKLSGVPPQVLAVISQAESGGEVAGAGVNPQGYGGYFGLSTGQYPGGSVTNAQLNTNSPDSFDAQAQVAASAFAAALQRTGGNVVAAEQIYVTGDPGGTPSDGTQLMSQYFGGSTINLVSLKTSPGASTPNKCDPIIRFPGVGGLGAVTILDKCQAQEVVGVLLMAAGGLVLFVGLALVAASMGTGRPLRVAKALPGPGGKVAATAADTDVPEPTGQQARAAAAKKERKVYTASGSTLVDENNVPF